MSSINADYYDEVGVTHNAVLANIGESYTLDGIANMSDTQLQEVIISEYLRYGSLPPSFNYNNAVNGVGYVMSTMNFDSPIDNLDYIRFKYPAMANECNVLKTYATTLLQLTESNILNYHIDFRNTVNNSNISLTSKKNIRTCSGIGYASANLWGVEILN